MICRDGRHGFNAKPSQASRSHAQRENLSRSIDYCSFAPGSRSRIREVRLFECLSCFTAGQMYRSSSLRVREGAPSWVHHNSRKDVASRRICECISNFSHDVELEKLTLVRAITDHRAACQKGRESAEIYRPSLPSTQRSALQHFLKPSRSQICRLQLTPCWCRGEDSGSSKGPYRACMLQLESWLEACLPLARIRIKERAWGIIREYGRLRWRTHGSVLLLYEYIGSSAEQSKIKRNGRRGSMADGLHASHCSRLILNLIFFMSPSTPALPVPLSSHRVLIP